jgi:hypothetical protein
MAISHYSEVQAIFRNWNEKRNLSHAGDDVTSLRYLSTFRDSQTFYFCILKNQNKNFRTRVSTRTEI